MITVTRNSITLSAAFLLPCTAFYWLWTTPNAIGGSTYIAGSALALATGVIAFNTLRTRVPPVTGEVLIKTTQTRMFAAVAVSLPTTVRLWGPAATSQPPVARALSSRSES